MSIGNSISLGTKGRYILQPSTTSSSDIPGPKTQLILKEIVVSSDSSGLPILPTPITVQSLNGVLRPLKPYEKEQWGKISIIASYAYYVSPSQFASNANKAKLVEKNVLVSATKTYEIVGIEDQTDVQMGAHYKVLLEVLS
jgi:hypothetical protein